MRLVSFVAPDSGRVHVGALSHDGARVVDLTAIGVDDVLVAIERVAQLQRLAGHLLHAEGAVAWPVDAVRLLAPVPGARSVHLLVAPEAPEAPAVRAGASGRALHVVAAAAAPRLRFDDPAPMLGSGDRVTAIAGDRWALGLGCVIGAEGTAIAETDAARHVAGLCVAARWLGDDVLAAPVVQLGPWLVTPDELADRRREDGRYDLRARVTGAGGAVREGNVAAAPLSVAALVAHASARHVLRVGDVLTMPLRDAVGDWLAVSAGGAGQVTFEVERLGALHARMAAVRDTQYAE